MSESGSKPTKPEEHAFALHEVSNALTVVLGWLDVAQSGVSASEVKDAVAIAVEHARRAQVLARGSIGAQVQQRDVDSGVGTLIDFLVLSLSPHARTKKVKLVCDLGSGLEQQPRDAATLTQVLTNLLLNAIAFTAESSEVTLSCERGAEDFRFVVEDDGPGVPESKVPTLFSFGGSGRVGGAGIGLSYSARLAEERGGGLRYSRGRRGARFELRWPVQGSSSVRPVGGGVIAPKALTGRRLVILEDDVAVLALIELALGARGAEVITVRSYDELEGVLSQSPDAASLGVPEVDAILLDLSPLAGREEERLREIRRLGGGAPVLLVSGRPEGGPKGCDGLYSAWIRKPFDMSQLVEEVVALLDPAPELASSPRPLEDCENSVGFS